MDLTLVIDNNCKPQARRGFALVVALSLMAFMLVLVVTLLSLMEVETRSASNGLELQKAREGARMALDMAIAQLQEHAGDDERVTARADITVATTTEATHWAGVWDSNITNPSYTTAPTFLTWLVSASDTIDPQVIGSANVVLNENNSLELVGDDSVSNADESIRAPIINILDANGNTSSRIAWWIGDEGTKASVAQLPMFPDGNRPTPNYIFDASRNSLQTMLTTTQGLEEVFRFNTYNRFTSSAIQRIDRVTNIKQLFDPIGLNLNWPSPIREESFHTLTPMSLGVLAGTTPNTGLMEDLSLFSNSISIDGASLASRSALQNYLNDAAGRALATDGEMLDPVLLLQRSVSMKETGSPSGGDIVNAVAPVLTNFMMAFAVYEKRGQTSGDTLLRMHFFCELWNPYTSSLFMKEDTGNTNLDDLELELEITGLPKVVVQVVETNISGNVTILKQGDEIDLQTILGDSGLAGNPVIIRLKYDTNESWLPGMTKNWTGIQEDISNPDRYYSSQTVSSEDDTSETTQKSDWNDPTYTLGDTAGFETGVSRTSSDLQKPVITPPEYDSIRIVTSNPTGNNPPPSNTLVVKVYSFNTVTNTRGLLLAQLDDVVYSPLETAALEVNDTAMGKANFGFHFILKGPDSSSPNYYRGDWILEGDPRSSNWLNSYTPVINGIIPQITPASPEVLFEDTIDISKPRRLFDRSDGSGNYYKSLWQDSPLFEVPRERILSLASLQHLHFYNERPFKVGNSWGDDTGINTLSWFDKYFLSGLSPNDDLDDFEQHRSFPNPMLISYEYADADSFGDESTSVAQKALVANRFNINSTSVEAWKAVLGGLRINDWGYLEYAESKPYPSELPTRSTYTNTDPINGDSRVALFARFSDSLHETFDAPETPDAAAPSEFYRRGCRFLNTAQIGILAQQIVNRIRTRGTPFLSMEQFLSNPSTDNQSLLEEAIESTVFTINDPAFSNSIQQWDRSWETTGVVDDDSDRIDIDHFSPGFLTQADIMTAIGPMLAPRSDTFKIRARCQTLSPFNSNEVIGDATIEAVVQRVPDPVDPDDDINDSINRKFKIMSVRWLTADEI